MLYTLRFFSSKCSLFHNANLFGSCISHILYTECAKIKKNYSGAKGLSVKKSTTLEDEGSTILRNAGKPPTQQQTATYVKTRYSNIPFS